MGVPVGARFLQDRVMVLQVVFLLLCVSAITTGAVLLLLVYARIERRQRRNAAVRTQLSEPSAPERREHERNTERRESCGVVSEGSECVN